MMPHMVASLRGSQDVLELCGTPVGGVLDERAFAGEPADAAQLFVRSLDGRGRLVARVGNQDFAARLEELIEASPGVGEDRRPARRRFEEAAGRTEAARRHGA